MHGVVLGLGTGVEADVLSIRMAENQIDPRAVTPVEVARALDELRRQGRHARTHEILGVLARGDVHLPGLPLGSEIDDVVDLPVVRPTVDPRAGLAVEHSGLMLPTSTELRQLLGRQQHVLNVHCSTARVLSNQDP